MIRKLTCHCGGVEGQVEVPKLGFKKVMIKRTEVLRPRVFLKMSVIKPKKKAYINKLITVVSSFIFKIKKRA